jgi:hypothetical protein
VIGRAVHLHPVITIFAVLVGLSTWGVLGGLLGVPVAAAINVTLHELYPEETGGHTQWDAAVKKAVAAAGPGGREVAAAVAEVGGGDPVVVPPAAGADVKRQ